MSERSLFEIVLASTVHDMKNSLSLLMGELDKISQKLDVESENHQAVSSIRYESSRINYSLMQMLTLYRLENNQLDVQIVEVQLADFLEDCIAAHAPLAATKSVKLMIDCDDSLIWFFDPDMVGIAINNIIGNCFRYSHSQILVTVGITEGRLLIQVDDDGKGYPESMLQNPDDFITRVNHSSGSTGLGLFFSSTIARYHKRSGNQGCIRLKNDGLLKGGCFRLFLP